MEREPTESSASAGPFSDRCDLKGGGSLEFTCSPLDSIRNAAFGAPLSAKGEEGTDD